MTIRPHHIGKAEYMLAAMFDRADMDHHSQLFYAGMGDQVMIDRLAEYVRQDHEQEGGFAYIIPGTLRDMSAAEADHAACLVDAILALGYSIRVQAYDEYGEDESIHSCRYREVLQAMHTNDGCDTLSVYKGAREVATLELAYTGADVSFDDGANGVIEAIAGVKSHTSAILKAYKGWGS